MLFYTGSFLSSMGMAGAAVGALAVFYALPLLPAVLVLLGPRVNMLSLPYGIGRGGGRLWHRLATAVMRRPVLVLVPSVALLVAAGIPFTHLRLANGDIGQLPAQAEARRGAELLTSAFPDRDQTTIDVVVSFPATPRTADRIGAVYDLSRRTAAIPGVIRVDTPVDLDPRLCRADYQRLLAPGAAALPAAAQNAVHQSVGTVTVQ